MEAAAVSTPVVVVVVIIVIAAAIAWWVWWRCTVSITLSNITKTLTPGSGGTIDFTATYASNQGHTFTAAQPVSISVTYSNPSAGSIGVAGSAGARPTMNVSVAPSPTAGQDGTITIGAYPAGAIFDITVKATDDNGDSGAVSFKVNG